MLSGFLRRAETRAGSLEGDLSDRGPSKRGLDEPPGKMDPEIRGDHSLIRDTAFWAAA